MNSQGEFPAGSQPSKGEDSAEPPGGEHLTATVKWALDGDQFQARLTVPAGPSSPAQLLPALRPLSEAILSVAVERARKRGQRVSCGPGCGACCRQLVPIAPPEARQIERLVEDLPEPRRSAIRERFEAVRRRLAEAGLLERLTNPEKSSDAPMRELGLDYFRLGIACPFLEDESCSIYGERPIACREYVVTSPAANCANPSPETVRIVPPLAKVWLALARVEEDPAARFVPWVPLSLAPGWAASHPEPPPTRTGKDLLETFLQKLTQKRRKEREPISID